MFKIRGLFSVAYIRRVDGFVGCYRGLGPKLCANTISSITYQKLYERTVEEVTVGEEDDEAAEDKR
jgi:carrier protein